SGVAFQKLLLVLYGVAFAAVPVLVAYGKAGVKGCDFVVINHVHILLCVHVEFVTLKIMHSIGQNRTPHCACIYSHLCLSDRPPAAGQRRSTGQQPGPAGAGWATSFPGPPAGWRKTKAVWPKHPPQQPAARLRPGWWQTGPAGGRAGSAAPVFLHS